MDIVFKIIFDNFYVLYLFKRCFYGFVFFGEVYFDKFILFL